VPRVVELGPVEQDHRQENYHVENQAGQYNADDPMTTQASAAHRRYSGALEREFSGHFPVCNIVCGCEGQRTGCDESVVRVTADGAEHRKASDGGKLMKPMGELAA
jgi:hypothetical protein